MQIIAKIVQSLNLLKAKEFDMWLEWQIYIIFTIYKFIYFLMKKLLNLKYSII